MGCCPAAVEGYEESMKIVVLAGGISTEREAVSYTHLTLPTIA